MGAVVSVDCVYCGREFVVRPRSVAWTGRIRTQLQCPHCSFIYGWKPLPSGIEPDQAKVQLRDFSGGAVFIDEYETPAADAERFAQAWNTVSDRLSSNVTALLGSYWKPECGEPHVWLLKNRAEWRGSGWAATPPPCRSFFFLSWVIEAAPYEVLETMIAHEIGHAVSFTAGEENHRATPLNARNKQACELIVWTILDAWGFDQQATDTWMENHLLTDSMRTVPLHLEYGETAAKHQRAQLIQAVGEFQFPTILEPFLTERRA